MKRCVNLSNIITWTPIKICQFQVLGGGGGFQNVKDNTSNISWASSSSLIWGRHWASSSSLIWDRHWASYSSLIWDRHFKTLFVRICSLPVFSGIYQCVMGFGSKRTNSIFYQIILKMYIFFYTYDQLKTILCQLITPTPSQHFRVFFHKVLFKVTDLGPL
jgi:hypothetical protein